MNRRLWVIAHRGGCALRPENTLAAFWNAINLGADMVEADVKWTKDKELVLLHSDMLEITTNAHGNVSEFTLRELRQLDAGSHFDPKYCKEFIPTLEELFRLCRNRIKVLLDLKAGEQYQYPIIELITAYRMEFDVVIGVRTIEALMEVKRLNPTIRVLSFGYPIEAAYEILEAGADIIRFWGSWVTPEHVDRVRSMGKSVWVMVGSPKVEEAGRTTLDELRWYKELGINGVLLDDPHLALQVNSEHG